MLTPRGVYRPLAMMVAVASGVIGWMTTDASAQCNHFNNFGNRVGGISVNALGVVAGPSEEAKNAALEQLRKTFGEAPNALRQPTEMRFISLKRLEAAVAAAMKDNAGALPDDLRYLAGLQRIQYVFVYPEQNDIVLAGPGEGWKLDENANIVGITTGRPVIELEDLVTALRCVKNARQSPISCSIDPTAEGRERFAQFMSKQKVFNPQVLDGIAQAMGPQKITITGVPGSSHYARVLVAADYRMKRYAMMLDPAPIKGFKSFLEMLADSGAKPTNMMPRWWLATNYDAIVRSEDSLAWELKGQGVKCMTEDEFVAGGEVKGTGKVNPVAQKWADAMNAKYDELSGKDGVFHELRNIMDMSVIAAIIDRHDLLNRANLQLPTLLGEQHDLAPYTWNVPKSVATQCSFLKKGKDYLITASGGVEINSHQIAASAKVANVKKPAATAANAWWWE